MGTGAPHEVSEFVGMGRMQTVPASIRRIALHDPQVQQILDEYANFTDVTFEHTVSRIVDNLYGRYRECCEELVRIYETSEK